MSFQTWRIHVWKQWNSPFWKSYLEKMIPSILTKSKSAENLEKHDRFWFPISSYNLHVLTVWCGKIPHVYFGKKEWRILEPLQTKVTKMFPRRCQKKCSKSKRSLKDVPQNLCMVWVGHDASTLFWVHRRKDGSIECTLKDGTLWPPETHRMWGKESGNPPWN